MAVGDGEREERDGFREEVRERFAEAVTCELVGRNGWESGYTRTEEERTLGRGARRSKGSKSGKRNACLRSN